MDLGKSNYDIQAEKAQLEFPKWNHKAIADKFNLIYDKEYLYINFINQKHRINRETGLVEKSIDGILYHSKAGFNEIMSIFDLFSYSKAQLELSGEWINMQSLGASLGATGHSGRAVGSDLFAPFSKYFSGKCSELAKACVQLGGEEVAYTDVSYIINVFDLLPVMVQFWDCDDEFSGEIKIFWDKNILDYVHFETTFFIAFHLLQRIKEAMVLSTIMESI
ncbi:uncharacterized protein DUF3786 [Alkalibaculum bacchi]|uniref:Uncharacterized protein DUF3786 n=1 Tax=Alkalibaculum bacchi TaxID=645887 RepID=A0A366HX76_9FIRM|nr:DUF3786 domain-containing protein [Alkalibaculum bacchi]RBP57399.1 uncharacterized protein DUF3786 [Alkalibaculum bacchi]